MNAIEMQEADEKARILVEKARAQLRDNPLTVEFQKGIPEEVLLGMGFKVTNLDYGLNVVTFTLIE